jgi:hypothetical protein
MKGHSMGRKLKWTAATAVAAAAVSAGIALATVNEVPVLVTPANELLPAADGDAGYLAWTQNSSAHRNHYDAFFSLNSGPKVRVNEAGTLGWTGGIDGNMLVYQQAVGNSSGLRLFDLTTQVRTAPTGVNTGMWEWQPTISGDWILFGRQGRNRNLVILHNTVTDETRTLVDQQLFAGPGQVNGDYATYVRCGAATCNVFRYQISTSQTTAAPNPRKRVQYGPSVSTDGTMYYGSSKQGCGSDVQVRKLTPGAANATLLTAFPPGRDFFGTYADDRTDGSTDVLHDRGRCNLSASNQNLFKLVDPA